MSPALSIELLNHASVIFRSGNFSLLSDPWFGGTCFKGNWGLRFSNPEALDQAASATHLWISHPHEDHLHFPTLKLLAQKAPNITVLANVSDNVSNPDFLKKLGFSKIILLGERKRLILDSDISVIRYPASRIDNMLVVEIAGKKLLNYNDCNVPADALRQLVREFGPIDVLLCNYNHAYKWWNYQSHEFVQERLKHRFSSIIREVKPKSVIPFASLHYYRSPYSTFQNSSHLTPESLAEVAPDSLIALHVGESVRFSDTEAPLIDRRNPAIPQSDLEEKKYKNESDWSKVLEASQKYCDKLRKSFPGISLWMQPVNILVDDHQRTVELNFRSGAKEVTAESPPVHIQLQSETLINCFTKPFGMDALWIGADFSFKPESVSVVHRFVMLGMLMDNGLGASNLIRMPFQPQKWTFFINRREEIAAILSQRRFNLGERV
ncbi:MAG TPA: MBL fold metallo-hydrolase [Trichormus sp.]|jgi:L-ascorbate metabolism protein UlaG (beta-lactamase superfamily)